MVNKIIGLFKRPTVSVENKILSKNAKDIADALYKAPDSMFAAKRFVDHMKRNRRI